MPSYPVVRIATSNVKTRQKTPGLWRNALEEFNQYNLGASRSEDFFDKADASAVDADGSGETRFGGTYFVQNSAAGGTDTNFATITDPLATEDSDSPIGTASLLATTGTDWFGASVSKLNKCVKTSKHSTDPRALLIWEARVDLSAADHYFLGFAEETVEFLGATGALPTDTDYIGFYRNDAGELEFVSGNDANGGTAVTYTADLLEAADIPDVANQYCKLGFRVNADFTVDIYVDEKKYVADTAGTLIEVTPGAIPIETLNELYEAQRGATGDLAAVAIDFDWIEVYNRK